MGKEIVEYETPKTWKAASKESMPPDGASPSEGTCPKCCDAPGALGQTCDTCKDRYAYLTSTPGFEHLKLSAERPLFKVY
jgi:hypothetical protein